MNSQIFSVLSKRGMLDYVCYLFVAVFGLNLIGFIPVIAQTSLGNKASARVRLQTTRSTEKSITWREVLPSRIDKTITFNETKTLRLPAFSVPSNSNTDLANRRQIGVVRQLEKPLAKISQGDIFSFANGKIWIAEIVSGSARQVRLHLTNVALPKGAKLFVYSVANPNETYEFSDNTESKDLWTPPIEGNSVRIEYFVTEEKDLNSTSLPFQVSEISHIYQTPVEDCETADAAPQLPCHEEVSFDWFDVSRSVALLQFVVGSSEYLCSGTMLNSVSQDFNPILLTANHCFNTQISAQTLRTYWFYYNNDFPDSTIPRSDGATLLSTGTANDYTLVLITGSVPNLLGLVYSGWDTTATPIGTSVTGLHHPQASYRRMSSGTTISGYCPTLPSVCTNFTGVAWNSGAIESGSNGSGLWKGTDFETGRLIGTLTNGAVSCTTGRGSYSNFGLIYQNISQYMQGGADDSYDFGGGNDTRNTAATISQGNYSNLITKWLDDDWYAITVPAGYRITVTANFIHNNGDLDLELYRGTETQPVSYSGSVTNSETVTHTTNIATTYYLVAYLFDGARNNYNLNINVQQSSNKSLFDFDGDRKTDISIFRPASGEWWYLRSSDSSNRAFQFGNSTDKLVPADFTGDGKTDIAFWRPSDGNWFVLRSEDSSFFAFPFGASGDTPVPADYDGDGKADPAVFRASSATWFIQKSSGGTDILGFGAAGDKPVPADYDGDGKADIAIFRPNGANPSEWWIRRSSNGSVLALQFGLSTDKPTQGDFTGDGKTDIAFWRPSNGNWFVLRSEDFSFFAFPFGANGDIPVAGDYDGDGKFDAGVFRPTNSTWFIQRSTAGTLIQQFGANGDFPVPSVFVP